MIYSNQIDDLRADVAANCRVFIALMLKAGFKVKIVNTIRDEEKQLVLFAEGVTLSKVPTFHAVRAGLAFDIVQDVAGHGYDDEIFWQNAAKTGKRIGFSWGGDWTSFPDKPHFQWDNHQAFTGSDILNGNLPPPMPLYKEEDDDMIRMTDEEFADYMNRYLDLTGTGDTPSAWAKTAVEAMKGAGVFNGDGKGNYGWQKPMTRESLAVILYSKDK